MVSCIAFLPLHKVGPRTIYFVTTSLIERFSFECRKTKTKVITLTNHNNRKQSYEPIRVSPVPSAGKRVHLYHDWFSVLLLIGRESGARFFNQSQSVAMQNQSNCGITFDTQLKSALSRLLWFCISIHGYHSGAIGFEIP